MAKANKSVKKPSAAKASKKKTLIAKKSPARKAGSKPKSAFTKEVHLFRDQKDIFSVDKKYAEW